MKLEWNSYYNKIYQNKEDSQDMRAMCIDLYYELLNRKDRKFRFKFFENILKNILKYFKGRSSIAKLDIDLIVYIDSFSAATYGQIRGVLQKSLKEKKRVAILCRKKLVKNEVIESYKKDGAFVVDLDKKYFKGIFNYIIKSFKLSNKMNRTISDLSKLISLEFALKNLYYRYNIEEILKVVKGRVIFQGYDSNIISAQLIYEGRKLGVKEYTIQHGTPAMINDVDDKMSIITENYIMWGKKSARFFSQKASTATKFHILGNPKMDMIDIFKSQKMVYREEIRESLNISEKKKIFLFMSQTHDLNKPLYHRAILKGLKEVTSSGSYQLIVKLHPSEGKKMYEEIFTEEELEKIIILKKEHDLYKLISASDIVASPYSTTLLEAMAIEVPCLQLNFTDEPLPIDFSVKEGCRYVSKPEELIKEIERILNERAELDKLIIRQNSFVEDNLANIGIATDTIYKKLFSDVD